MLRQLIIATVVLLAAALGWRLFGAAIIPAGGSLKSLFVPVVTLYLDTFNSPTTAVFLCLAMVVVGLGLLFYFSRWRIGPARRDLRRLAEQLAAIREDGAPDAALRRIDAAIRRDSMLGKSWAVYRATLVKGPDGRIFAQFPPKQYFDMSALELSGLHLRLFFGLPNDFVGIGLVFTFLGLVAGLYFASQSMMSPDIGAARDALVLLLHAATFKFLTSITGIGLSLLLSWSQRSLVDGLYYALGDVQYQIERLLPLNAAHPLPLAASPVVASGASPQTLLQSVG